MPNNKELNHLIEALKNKYQGRNNHSLKLELKRLELRNDTPANLLLKEEILHVLKLRVETQDKRRLDMAEYMRKYRDKYAKPTKKKLNVASSFMDTYELMKLAETEGKEKLENERKKRYSNEYARRAQIIDIQNKYKIFEGCHIILSMEVFVEARMKGFDYIWNWEKKKIQKVVFGTEEEVVKEWNIEIEDFQRAVAATIQVMVDEHKFSQHRGHYITQREEIKYEIQSPIGRPIILID